MLPIPLNISCVVLPCKWLKMYILHLENFFFFFGCLIVVWLATGPAIVLLHAYGDQKNKTKKGLFLSKKCKDNLLLPPLVHGMCTYCWNLLCNATTLSFLLQCNPLILCSALSGDEAQIDSEDKETIRHVQMQMFRLPCQRQTTTEEETHSGKISEYLVFCNLFLWINVTYSTS